jgi:ABC-type transport system involved in multi-copper enzyme maturation permease subunit
MTGFALWQKQVLAIVGLEWKKTLFAKRGLWVYALAFLPALLFGINAIRVMNYTANQDRVLAQSPNAGVVSGAIRTGMTIDASTKLLLDGKVPYTRFTRGRNREYIRYSDGMKTWELVYRDGLLTDKRNRSEAMLSESIRAFAGVFQYFFVRLAIFFGCVGIFMNLFRGEMLDQSLHHYLLAPVRREVLMVGKYLAGLVATIAIFATSAAMQFFFLLSAYPKNEVTEYLNGPGWGHLFGYLGVTALACVGYGSIFLAAGIIMRNPLIPATVILFWEGINWFLPVMMKKFSVIYYLQSLCPVVAPVSADIPEALKILVTTAAPMAAPLAVLGIFTVSALVLGFASIYIKKLEINYSSD